MFTGKSSLLSCIIYRSAKIYSMKCDMIYRRVTEVTEVDQPTIPGLTNHWSQRPSFGLSGFNNQQPRMGPFFKRKRSMESWEELSLSEEVRSFKRVRILSNIKKTRKTAFSSWEDKSSWSMTENDRIDTAVGDDSLRAKSTPTAEVDAPFKTLLTESIILSGATFFLSDKDKKSGEGTFTSTLGSEEVSSSSEQRICSAGESAYDFKQVFQAPADDDEETWSVQPRNTMEVLMSDSDHRLEIKNREYRGQYVRKLSADRARLLQLLPSGPILAPTLGVCRVLDIGSSDTWPSMGKLMSSMFRFFQAIRCKRFGGVCFICSHPDTNLTLPHSIAAKYMPTARIQTLETSENWSRENILYKLDLYGTGQCDLIHMQDWTWAAALWPALPDELYR